MQIWQLFIVPRHPVTISVIVFLNMTKLTKDLHINRSLAKQMMRLEWKYDSKKFRKS